MQHYGARVVNNAVTSSPRLVQKNERSLTELVLADGGDGAVQLQSGQRQVVSLTAGVLPHLLDPDVSPALLLLFGRVQRPRGRRPETDGDRQTASRQPIDRHS